MDFKNQFTQDAKTIVDLMFDKNYFAEAITRDDMNTFEEFVKFLLESRFDSYVRIETILRRMEERKNKKSE